MKQSKDRQHVNFDPKRYLGVMRTLVNEEQDSYHDFLIDKNFNNNYGFNKRYSSTWERKRQRQNSLNEPTFPQTLQTQRDEWEQEQYNKLLLELEKGLEAIDTSDKTPVQKTRARKKLKQDIFRRYTEI